MKIVFYSMLLTFCFITNSYALDNISFTARTNNTLDNEELFIYKQLRLPEVMLIIKNKKREPFAYGMMKNVVSRFLVSSIDNEEFLSSTKLVHCLDGLKTEDLIQDIVNDGKTYNLKDVPFVKYAPLVALNKCEYFSNDKYSEIMKNLGITEKNSN